MHIFAGQKWSDLDYSEVSKTQHLLIKSKESKLKYLLFWIILIGFILILSNILIFLALYYRVCLFKKNYRLPNENGKIKIPHQKVTKIKSNSKMDVAIDRNKQNEREEIIHDSMFNWLSKFLL